MKKTAILSKGLYYFIKHYAPDGKREEAFNKMEELLDQLDHKKYGWDEFKKSIFAEITMENVDGVYKIEFYLDLLAKDVILTAAEAESAEIHQEILQILSTPYAELNPPDNMLLAETETRVFFFLPDETEVVLSEQTAEIIKIFLRAKLANPPGQAESCADLAAVTDVSRFFKRLS